MVDVRLRLLQWMRWHLRGHMRTRKIEIIVTWERMIDTRSLEGQGVYHVGRQNGAAHRLQAEQGYASEILVGCQNVFY